MKSLILGLLLLSSFSAQAGIQKLACGDHNKNFTADLDDSSYRPGSGYADIKNPRVQDGFITMNLECAGTDLEKVSCIGHLGGSPLLVIEVTFIKQEGLLIANVKSLKGSLMSLPNSFGSCTID